jgi:hypothetical protein
MQMTVKELIAKLSEFDGDTRVLVNYDGEYIDAKAVVKTIASPRSDLFYRDESSFRSIAEFLSADWVDEEDKVGAFEAVEVSI